MCGCAEEFVLPTLLDTAPPEEMVGPVPEDLANLLWGDLDNLIETLEGIPLDQPRDYYINQIAFVREQRAFYGKYINAGGVAIIGNADLDDICFYAARDAVFAMTSKMPELREYLSPIDGERMNLTGSLAVPDSEFRMVIHDHTHVQSLPERKIGQVASLLGSCGLEFCHATTVIHEDHNGKLVLSMGIFVHEFAHAIQLAINLVDATFTERLKTAYQDAKANDDSYWGRYDGGANVAESNGREYWAYCSDRWFTRFLLPTNLGKQHHTLFRESDPLMYALLSEIYDLQLIQVDVPDSR